MVTTMEKPRSEDPPEPAHLSGRGWRLTSLAWLPIPILLVAIVVLWAANLRVSHELPNLLMGLNFVFAVLASLIVVYLIGRSFLVRGSPGLLLVGCGVVLWGLAGEVGIAVSHGNANNFITIHNTCVWLSALCHLAGVVLSLRPRRTLRATGLWLGAGLALAVGAVGLVAMFTLAGWLPTFFVQGQGGTLVRSFVLGSAVGMFVLSAVLLRAGNRPSFRSFAYWYSLALLLIATGLFGIMIESVHGSPLSWTGRTAQFLSGVYMLIAALASARGLGIRGITLGRRLSEARYRHKYGMAIAIVLSAAAVRLAFLQGLETRVAFITFFPAVMLAALYGGLRAGLLAAVLSTVVADYFWIGPVGFSIADAADWLSIGVFLASCTMISWITEAMHRAQARATAAEAETRFGAERGRAATALRESELRYRRLFEHMLDGFAHCRMIFDDQGRPIDFIYLEVNSAFGSLTGLENVVGKRVSQVIPGIRESNPELFEAYTRVSRGGSPERFEISLKELGTSLCISAYHSEPEHFVAVFDNITERKRAEQALEEALQRLRFHVENSPLAVIEFDADLRVSRWTREAERIFGWSAEEVLGEWMYEIPWIHEKDRQKVDLVSQSLRNGRNARNISPNRNYRKDGSVIYCEWYNSTLMDASGKMASIFSLVQDVTERVRAEQQLQALNETLEQRVTERTAEAKHRAAQLQALAAELVQAEQRERQRLALVLHDHLQQLLVGMKFSISMLRSHLQAGDGPKILRQLEDIVDQSIETSRSLTIELCPPILTKGSMSEVLHWLAGWFASKHGLRVEVQTDEQVDPQVEQVRVLLFQAARELLFNIVKHAGVDRASVEMTLLADGRACVTVTDAGVGFDATKVEPGGKSAGGFGLFSLRERMEMIGGQLQIDSAPGKGTRATLIAPLQLAEGIAREADTTSVAASAVAVTAQSPPDSALEDNGPTLRVLLADDHQVMRDGLARLLQTQPGIQVVAHAADGLQAVDMTLQLRPDIVIMDVNMPRLDGVEATRKIHARLPGTQIIALSMFDESNVQEAMLDAGAAAYLAKTSAPEALLAAIRGCVAGVVRRRE